MECLLQYLDDIDDFVGMFAMAAERLRRIVRGLLILSLSLGILTLGVMLAFTKPPLALAIVFLLAVGLLYRAVVDHPPRTPLPV